VQAPVVRRGCLAHMTPAASGFLLAERDDEPDTDGTAWAHGLAFLEAVNPPTVDRRPAETLALM